MVFVFVVVFFVLLFVVFFFFPLCMFKILFLNSLGKYQNTLNKQHMCLEYFSTCFRAKILKFSGWKWVSCICKLSASSFLCFKVHLKEITKKRCILEYDLSCLSQRFFLSTEIIKGLGGRECYTLPTWLLLLCILKGKREDVRVGGEGFKFLQ